MKTVNRDAVLTELCKSEDAEKVLKFLRNLQKNPKITRGLKYSLQCIEKDYQVL